MNVMRPHLKIEMQRGIALLMFVLECVAIAYISHTRTFPIAMVVIALVGTFSKLRFQIDRSRAYDIVAVLGVVFTLKHMYSAENARYSTLFPSQQIALSIAQYVLCLQATLFFSRRNDGRLPVMFPGIGVIALVCASIVRVENNTERGVFQAFCIAFALLAAKYCDLSRRFVSLGSRRTTGRTTTSLIILLMIGVLGWSAATGLYRFEGKVEQYLIQILSFRKPTYDVGFSDTSTLGSVNLTRTEHSDEIALRIVSELSPGYFRGRAYDRYQQARWGVSIGEGQPISPQSQSRINIQPSTHSGNIFDLVSVPNVDGGKTSNDLSLPAIDELSTAQQTPRYSQLEVWPTSAMVGHLFAPLNTICIQAPVAQIHRDAYEILRARDLTSGSPYSLYVSQTAHTPTIAPPTRRNRVLLQLPRWTTQDPRIKSLVDHVCRGQTTVRGKADAIQRFFQQHFQYSLEVNVPDSVEPLQWFLNERPAAHCEYFASATVMMLRLADVPCRYVSGFIVQEQSRFSGNWVARQRDAHAWAEAQDEAGQWFVVESTPSDGLPSTDRLSVVTEFWEFLVDHAQRLRLAWQRFGFIGVLRQFGELLTSPIGVFLLLALMVPFAIKAVARTRFRRSQPPTFEYVTHELESLRTRLDRVIQTAFRQRGNTETIGQFTNALASECQHPTLQSVAKWYRRYQDLRFGSQVSTTEAAKLAHDCAALLATIKKLQLAATTQLAPNGKRTGTDANRLECDLRPTDS